MYAAAVQDQCRYLFSLQKYPALQVMLQYRMQVRRNPNSIPRRIILANRG